MFCTCDICCTSVCPRERDPSSVVLSEVSYFSLTLSIDSGFCNFFLTWWEGLRTEDVTPVQLMKPHEINCNLRFWAIQKEIWLTDWKGVLKSWLRFSSAHRFVRFFTPNIKLSSVVHTLQNKVLKFWTQVTKDLLIRNSYTQFHTPMDQPSGACWNVDLRGSNHWPSDI